MKQTPAQRKRILRWRRFLREFSDGITLEKSQDVGLELLALDMAHIELGISGLVNKLGNESSAEILTATLEDIAAGALDGRHWRSIEARKELDRASTTQDVMAKGRTDRQRAPQARRKR